MKYKIFWNVSYPLFSKVSWNVLYPLNWCTEMFHTPFLNPENVLYPGQKHSGRVSRLKNEQPLKAHKKTWKTWKITKITEFSEKLKVEMPGWPKIHVLAIATNSEELKNHGKWGKVSIFTNFKEIWWYFWSSWLVVVVALCHRIISVLEWLPYS